MKYSIAFFLVWITCMGKAQELVSSNTSIESCNDQRDCLTLDHVSYLFYDESKNEFYLKVDFSDFKHDGDTTGNWINDMNDTLLYFKAMLQEEDFPTLSNQNTKTLRLNGRIFYNGIWKDQVIDLNVFPTENSIVPSSTTNNYKYDNYKVSFRIPFVPKDFKAYKKLYYNNQTVSIAVTLGRINFLKPGMEFHLKDIYFQSTR